MRDKIWFKFDLNITVNFIIKIGETEFGDTFFNRNVSKYQNCIIFWQCPKTSKMFLKRHRPIQWIWMIGIIDFLVLVMKSMKKLFQDNMTILGHIILHTLFIALHTGEFLIIEVQIIGVPINKETGLFTIIDQEIHNKKRMKKWLLNMLKLKMISFYRNQII